MADRRTATGIRRPDSQGRAGWEGGCPGWVKLRWEKKCRPERFGQQVEGPCADLAARAC